MQTVYSLTCTDPEHKYVGTLTEIQTMLSDLAYLEDKDVKTIDSPTESSIIALADIVWDLPPDELFLTPIP